MMTRRSFSGLLGGAGLMAQAVEPPELDWHDARKLTVEGLGFKDVASPYDRLPARAESVVRKAVWDLSRDPSGVLVRFMANTTAIHARWTVRNAALGGPLMTATAQSGLDLYARNAAGKWQWRGIGRPTKFPENVDVLATGMSPGDREYMVYLPLRNPLTSLEIGVPKRARVDRGPSRDRGRSRWCFMGRRLRTGSRRRGLG